MRLTLAILTTCAVLAFASTGCSKSGTEPEQRGTISCVSLPAGAAIWLDGTDTGQVTDAELTNVSLGDHVVTLALHGYYPHTETVVVASADPVQVSHTFTERQPAVLRVLSDPPGATITVNDTLLSIVTPAVIPDARRGHDNQCFVSLNRSGYYPYFEAAPLSSGDTTTVSTTLMPCPDIDLTMIGYGSNFALYAVKADGLGQRTLATNVGDANFYQVSPDGRYVAYVRRIGPSTVGLSVIGWDGNLIADLPYASFDFVWSNAGDQLVFSGGEGIYVYDAPANTTQRVFETTGSLYNHNPTFSSGDSLIAFLSHHYGQRDVRVGIMRADGNNLRYLTALQDSLSSDVRDLCWAAPDLILWTGGDGIYRLDPIADTSERVITAFYPSKTVCSPDRTRYAFIEGTGLYVGTVGAWDRRRLSHGYADFPRWLADSASLQYWGDDYLNLVFWDGTAYPIAPLP